MFPTPSALLFVLAKPGLSWDEDADEDVLCSKFSFPFESFLCLLLEYFFLRSREDLCLLFFFKTLGDMQSLWYPSLSDSFSWFILLKSSRLCFLTFPEGFLLGFAEPFLSPLLSSVAGPIIRTWSFLLNFTVFEGFLSSAKWLFNIPGDDKFDRTVDILSFLFAVPPGWRTSKMKTVQDK